MTLAMRDGGNVPQTIVELQVRDGANTPRDLTELRVRDSNNVSRIIFSTASPLNASASPPDVFGYDVGAGTATTNDTTVTPTGGVPGYTYLWTVGTYSGLVPIINSPTAATSTFTQSGLSSGEYNFATFICTVTDSNGSTVEVAVPASFFSEGTPP